MVERGSTARSGALRPHLRVSQEHLAPLRRLAPALEHAPIDQRPAVEVVVDVAREDEPVDQRRVEEQLLEALQRTEPDQIAAADADQVLADVEVPVLVRRVDVADDLDLARIADAEADPRAPGGCSRCVSGSKPIIFADTASIATWSADASITFLTIGNIVRGPGPLPAVVPSMIAKRPG